MDEQKAGKIALALMRRHAQRELRDFLMAFSSERNLQEVAREAGVNADDLKEFFRRIMREAS